MLTELAASAMVSSTIIQIWPLLAPKIKYGDGEIQDGNSQKVTLKASKQKFTNHIMMTTTIFFMALTNSELHQVLV